MIHITHKAHELHLTTVVVCHKYKLSLWKVQSKNRGPLPGSLGANNACGQNIAMDFTADKSAIRHHSEPTLQGNMRNNHGLFATYLFIELIPSTIFHFIVSKPTTQYNNNDPNTNREGVTASAIKFFSSRAHSLPRVERESETTRN